MIENRKRKKVLKSDEAGYTSAENACCIYFNDKIGPCRAFPYTQLTGAEMTQDQTQLTMSFSSGTVLIEGDDLIDIFTLLCARRLVGVSVFTETLITKVMDKVSVNSIVYSMNPRDNQV